jgi:hypothetical protein
LPRAVRQALQALLGEAPAPEQVMSEDPQRPRSDSMPPIVWGILGLLVVALFVLALGILGRP